MNKSHRLVGLLPQNLNIILLHNVAMTFGNKNCIIYWTTEDCTVN